MFVPAGFTNAHLRPNTSCLTRACSEVLCHDEEAASLPLQSDTKCGPDFHVSSTDPANSGFFFFWFVTGY